MIKRVFKNKLLNNIFIFMISTVLNKGLNFFMLPILTYYLTKTDYGYLGFIVSVVAISSIYVGLWPSNFIMAKFSAYGKEKMAYYISNIFVLIMITFILVLGFMLIFEDIIFANFENSTFLIYMILIYTLFMVIFTTFNTIIELEKNAIKYALFQSLYLIASLSIALVLIIKLDFDWRGKFYAELAILSLIVGYSIYYFIKERYIVFDINLSRLKELFLYLFPTSFYVVGLFLMGTIDKVFLAKYLDIESVGIYTIAMTMSIIVNIVYDSAMKAWEPYFFEKIATKKAEDMNFIIRGVTAYTLLVIVFAYIYIQIVPYIFSFMIDEKFNESLLYIPLLVIGFSFEGLRKPLSSFLMHINMVKTLGFITLGAAVVNIILNIILIQKFGISGAAYATIISFAFLYIVTLFLVFKYCDITWTKGV